MVAAILEPMVLVSCKLTTPIVLADLIVMLMYFLHTGQERVMYLQQTDNTRVRKSGKMAPFHPHVRGLHHGIHPNVLHTSPGLSSLAVLHAPCAVARHTSGN